MMFLVKKVVNVVLAVLFIAIRTGASAEFPKDPKPCKPGNSDCILNIINYFISQKYEGDGYINLVSLDPLDVSQITVSQGAESPVNIDLTFFNSKIHGIAKARAIGVKGFGRTLNQKHSIHLRIEKVSLVGDYRINGKVLILPMHGEGRSNITLTNLDLKMQLVGKTLEKNNKKYLTLEDTKLTLKPKRVYYQFDNLFNGDKALGDNMNLFLNENWDVIFKEVKKSMSDSVALIFQRVINNVFSKYPYEEYFTQD